MNSTTGTLASRKNHDHPTTSTYLAAGVMAVAFACVLALAGTMPPLPLAEMAMPPGQTAALLHGDASLPAAATVFNGREVGLEESAPTI